MCFLAMGKIPDINFAFIFKRNPVKIIKFVDKWALVAHACNPSYSVGRDQQAHNLRPAQAK
jgi:hypothetical protein